jgi:transposase
MRRRILLLAIRNPLSPVKELKENMEIEFPLSQTPSPSTIKNVLINSGLKARRRPKKWVISEINKIKRVKWCKVLQNFSSQDWEKVVFSDECRFDKGFLNNYGRWRKEDPQSYQYAVQTTRWGPSVHVWGAITYDGIFLLKFLDKNVNGSTYLEVLRQKLPPLYPQFEAGELIFQQDGATAHHVRDVLDYFEKNSITTLPWPPQSPDLNIIENVWGFIKSRLGVYYENVDQLKEDILKAWRALEVSVIQNLYKSLPRRVEAVIRNKGNPTKY